MRRLTVIVRTLLFIAITAAAIWAADRFVLPAWPEWSNFNTMHSFYREPDNTVEAAFLGASTIINGIIPAQMYEDYGLCTYNMATQAQPMETSYYWLEEIYRQHGDTLKTVVLDMSEIRRTRRAEFYHKAMDSMKLSGVKWRSILERYTDLDDRISALFPLFSFHERWSEIGEEDFEKSGYEVDLWARGWNPEFRRYLDAADYRSIVIPKYVRDDSVEELEFNRRSLFYLTRAADFCSEHGLRLILMKTPDITGWGDSESLAAERLAKSMGLEYYDFNFEPLISEIDYNAALDSTDGRHMNYRGARKLTDWYGRFLTEKCGLTDVRGVDAYRFMEKELEDYRAAREEFTGLNNATDPAAYIRTAMENPDNEIFIAVRGDAGSAMSASQRSAFADLGLTTLSLLEKGDSYIGVIDAGKVFLEERDSLRQHPEILEENPSYLESMEAASVSSAAASAANSPPSEESGAASAASGESGSASAAAEAESGEPVNGRVYELESVPPESPEPLYLKRSGMLENGDTFVLTGGGELLGNTASLLHNDVEVTGFGQGLGIAIYDRSHGRMRNTAVFPCGERLERESYDTEAALKRALSEGSPLMEKQERLALYNRRCVHERTQRELKLGTGKDGLLSFLEAYRSMEGVTAILCTKGDASAALEQDARQALASMGFETLAGIGRGDSYIGILEDGRVVYEASDEDGGRLAYRFGGLCSAESCGARQSRDCSIKIGGEEYAPGKRGVNIVIYDSLLKRVVHKASYDTHAIPAAVPENV